MEIGIIRRTLVFVALLALTACSSADTSDTALTSAEGSTTELTTTTGDATTTVAAGDVQVAESLAFSTMSANKLDVYNPTGQGPWPVVIVVHGASQRRNDFAPLAMAIAERGAVVFNVDATMSSPFESAIADVACSVRLAKATAAEYGGEPERVTLVGNSAGAAVGMIVALTGDDVAHDCVADESGELDAIVGYEGPFDWATTVYGPIDLPALASTDPDLWKAADPYAHLGGNSDLVVRLIHGDDDDQAWFEVPRSVSLDFHQSLTDAGYDAEITLIDGASHTAIAGSGAGTVAFETAVEQTIALARG